MANKDYVNLNVAESVADGKTRRIVRLTGGIEMFYEFDRIVPRSNDAPFDGYVFAVLLYAMSHGKPLIVEGPLSQSAVRNIEELQMVWSRWKPNRYKKIAVVPERVISVNSEKEGAIAAFSGGVDATFTALQNAHSKDPKKYPVSTVLLVHGFDVTIEDENSFEKLVSRIKPFIDDLKLDLLIVRTNSGALQLQDWEDTFSLQLAAILHQFSGEFGYGLIGSSEPYDALVIPWGSSPITDHLMSGDAFRIVHDGAGYSRTDKVEAIRHSPIARQILKVCWEGEDQASNCGKCEKCVRTRLNFLAAGEQLAPECFQSELDLDSISNMNIRNAVQHGELSTIAAYADSHNVTGPWLSVLKAKIADWQEKYEATKLEISNAALQRAALEAASQNTPEAYLDLSDKYYRVNRFQSAIEAARSAIALRPACAEAFNNICAACNQLDQFEEARIAGQEAVRLAPDFKLAKANLASSMRRLGIHVA